MNYKQRAELAKRNEDVGAVLKSLRDPENRVYVTVEKLAKVAYLVADEIMGECEGVCIGLSNPGKAGMEHFNNRFLVHLAEAMYEAGVVAVRPGRGGDFDE